MHPLEVETSPNATSGEEERRLAELADAIVARDSFIAIAAHELRNPMTPMIGQIELLLRGVKLGKYSLDQVQERLERIHQTMSHYLKRAATLLDVSRITSGKFILTPVPCDLADIVRQVANTFDETARHSGASIAINGPRTLPGAWDRLAVEQIIDNLVSNAIKYGGGNAIAISMADLGDDAGAVIRVRDHGPGISQSDRSRIFGQFERVVGLREMQSGFGVGLWVVGQIVEAMEGTVTVDDAPGGGSVFTVILPRHVKADARGR